MNEDQKILELEIGQIVCFEDDQGNVFTGCEVIGVNELLNQVQLLYFPGEESRIKITKWVDGNDVFLEGDLVFL